MTESDVTRRTVTVGLPNGLHMVPCSGIAKLAAKSASTVRIVGNNVTADAKSVLDLLQLKAECGAELIVEAEGEDAAAAVESIVRLFETNFDPDGDRPESASTDTALP